MKVQKIKGRNLLPKQISLMNKYRIKEFGKGEAKNFKQDEKDSIFFFIKNQNKIIAFGMLKPIKINYLGETYNIFGFANIVSIIKKKGYGKTLIKIMLDYLREKQKTGLGFTFRRNITFFEKSGLKNKKDLIERFRYKNPVTGKIIKDNIGDGIYFEGKDGFVKKILSTTSIIYIDIPFW